MFDTTKYFPRSVDSDHPSQLEPNEPTPFHIPVTYEMVHNLVGNSPDLGGIEVASGGEQDTEDGESVETTAAATPQLMIIFEEGDFNSALHFLIESVHNPSAPNAVAMVLVEEKIREEIVKRIEPRVRPPCKCGASNLEEIKADTSEVAPPRVCKCPLKAIGGDYPTGSITFHTFRNSQEAIDICQRETLPFASVSIWNENLDWCYELVVALSSPHFFLNCTNVDLSPISRQLTAKQNYVAVENGFHFESLHIYNQFKVIVFPIGELILPKPENLQEEPEPISFLES
ncbi:uncharacterized protein LOC108041434 [Drosophila rhopaloa]|uniref:Uncharacterized protein LOC108041434 n=1 Tax=Drosophila rhopaloa TaxID=1041015 RepID=A0A6P4EA09_DRORH|nr:uncharacterized protein LOC108041434 [Drosophila rhopaloa]